MNGAPTFEAITTEILLAIARTLYRRREDINHEYGPARKSRVASGSAIILPDKAMAKAPPRPTLKTDAAMPPVLSFDVWPMWVARPGTTGNIGISMKELFQRVEKHAKLTWQNLALPDVPSPPFLISIVQPCLRARESCLAKSLSPAMRIRWARLLVVALIVIDLTACTV
jgi:hypothetical protein